jgi:hypothetical protein
MKKPKYVFPIGEQIPNTFLTPLIEVRFPMSKGGYCGYEFLCACGKKIKAITRYVRIGRIVSCGCKRGEKHKYTRAEAIGAFFEKVYVQNQKCWIWHGSKNGDGYGCLSFMGKSMGAHRASWLIHNGEIPEGKSVLHECDNPPCVNPAHLFLGTQGDNVRDCARKGRIRGGKGHSLTRLYTGKIIQPQP